MLDELAGIDLEKLPQKLVTLRYDKLAKFLETLGNGLLLASIEAEKQKKNILFQRLERAAYRLLDVAITLEQAWKWSAK